MKKQSLFFALILVLALMISTAQAQQGPTGYFDGDFSEDINEAKQIGFAAAAIAGLIGPHFLIGENKGAFAGDFINMEFGSTVSNPANFFLSGNIGQHFSNTSRFGLESRARGMANWDTFIFGNMSLRPFADIINFNDQFFLTLAAGPGVELSNKNAFSIPAALRLTLGTNQLGFSAEHTYITNINAFDRTEFAYSLLFNPFKSDEIRFGLSYTLDSVEWEEFSHGISFQFRFSKF